MGKKYIDFVDLNGRHNHQFKFHVRVTWDKFNDPEYVLWNLRYVIAKDNHDAESIAKDKFLIEIMGTADPEQRKYLTAYVINYLNAEMVEVNFPRTEKELDDFNEKYADYPQVPKNELINPIDILNKANNQ